MFHFKVIQKYKIDTSETENPFLQITLNQQYPTGNLSSGCGADKHQAVVYHSMQSIYT